jgi:flagellar assembly factor FliW
MVELSAPSPSRTMAFPRFGSCTFSEDDVFAFPWGLPGFPKSRSFVALSVGNAENIIWLQSLDEPTVAVPIADPWLFFPAYDPKLPSFAQASLELERPEDFALQCVVVLPASGVPTMNLAGPVVLNLRSRIGRQVSLEGGQYAMRAPLPEGSVATAEVQAS